MFAQDKKTALENPLCVSIHLLSYSNMFLQRQAIKRAKSRAKGGMKEICGKHGLQIWYKLEKSKTNEARECIKYHKCTKVTLCASFILHQSA